MTLEQLDAVLKAFAWRSWESSKSSAPATLSYNPLQNYIRWENYTAI